MGRNNGGLSVPIPDLYGLTISEAKSRVESIGNLDFFLVCPTCITSEDSLKARVESQSPEFIEGSMTTSGTTMSAFALDSSNLLESNQYISFIVNIFTNVGLSIAALIGGKSLMTAIINN